jgi:hypothetical protein
MGGAGGTDILDEVQGLQLLEVQFVQADHESVIRNVAEEDDVEVPQFLAPGGVQFVGKLKQEKAAGEVE